MLAGVGAKTKKGEKVLAVGLAEGGGDGFVVGWRVVGLGEGGRLEGARVGAVRIFTGVKS